MRCQTTLVNTAAVQSNDWTTGQAYKWLANARANLWAARQLQLSSSAAHLPIKVRAIVHSIMLKGTRGVVYELMQP